MCFGALVCILYVFNRVQSCSIHIQFVHNDTRFSEPAASKIYRSQENSLKKQPLANTGHCEFSCVRVIPQSEPTSSNWPQKGQYFHLSPRPSQGQHEIKNHPFYRTHPCFTPDPHCLLTVFWSWVVIVLPILVHATSWYRLNQWESSEISAFLQVKLPFSMAEASVRGQVEWPSRGVRMLSPCHGSAELVELMENYRKHMKTVLEYDSVWYSDGVQSSTMDYGEYGRGWSSSVQKDTPNFLTVFFEPTIMGRNSKKMQKVKWQRTTSSVVREPEDHGEY